MAGKTLRFKKAAVCTGARATAPPIPGLEEAGYLTNETIFSLTGLPPRLAVIRRTGITYMGDAKEKGIELTTLTVPPSDIDRAG